VSASKGALFQVRLPLVSEGECEGQDLIEVSGPGQAILAPAVRGTAGQIVRQKIPGISVAAVVLTDRPPGTLGYARTPATPGREVAVPAGEAFVLLLEVNRIACHVWCPRYGLRSLGTPNIVDVARPTL
jgi:hypothetical protein